MSKPLTNKQKENILMDKYFKDNFEKEQIGKVNLDKNEVVLNMKSATSSNYTDELLDKKVKTLSSEIINMEKGKKALKIVAYCSTNYYDLNNPQKGRVDNRYVTALKNELETHDPEIKTIAFFGGDLLGEEWTMAHLKKATITKDGVAIYWGLNKRKQKLLTDIKIALATGADVYLMQGAQEHKIFKETGRDILKEVAEYFNSPRVKYIDEGTTVICNLVSNNGRKVYNTIGFQTNMIGKAQDSKGDFNAAIKSNGAINADVVFVMNGNAAGKFGSNIYHVSGQSMFKKTAKGKRPQLAPSNYNVFTIYPEGNHNLTVVEGSPENLYSESLVLEKEIHKQNETRKILGEIAKEKFDEKINQMVK